MADLLTSRSGVCHTALGEVAAKRQARPPRASHSPGTFWYYNNWDFNALGIIFEQETGSLTLIKPFQRYISAKYLLHWLNSPEGTQRAIENIYGRGVSQGNLNVNQVRKFIVPIPPLDEQERIASKVDQLMALCDDLETKLVAGQDKNGKLLEAAVADMLAA